MPTVSTAIWTSLGPELEREIDVAQGEFVVAFQDQRFHRLPPRLLILPVRRGPRGAITLKARLRRRRNADATQASPTSIAAPRHRRPPADEEDDLRGVGRGRVDLRVAAEALAEVVGQAEQRPSPSRCARAVRAQADLTTAPAATARFGARSIVTFRPPKAGWATVTERRRRPPPPRPRGSSSWASR